MDNKKQFKYCEKLFYKNIYIILISETLELFILESRNKLHDYYPSTLFLMKSVK